MHYTAVLGDVATFGKELWHLAVTADGTAWIWRLAHDLFPTATQIVDWYHACQHLAEAATAHFPDDVDQAQQWLKHLTAHLWRGELHAILALLRQAGLNPHYFEEHQRRMDYPTFHAAAYPIASGTIESGVKQFKQRLCAAGICWSRSGLQHMLRFRAASLSQTFEQAWALAA